MANHDLLAPQIAEILASAHARFDCSSTQQSDESSAMLEARRRVPAAVNAEDAFWPESADQRSNANPQKGAGVHPPEEVFKH